MRLGIDASNLRDGGGITHLRQILRAVDPVASGIGEIVIWASHATLAKLPDAPWLERRTDPLLERNYFLRALWQWRRLGTLAREEGCDLLFVPGGVFLTEFRPIVTMSRNLLPFEWRELFRYGFSAVTLRLMLLRWGQVRAFRRASGMIFLTEHARRAVSAVTGPMPGRITTIPHGTDISTWYVDRPQASFEDFAWDRPFRLLYISIVDVYKHQWHVAEAVALLRQQGLPASLTLIGPAYPPALRRLNRALRRVDPGGGFTSYVGPVRHDELPQYYRVADACLFASSCENMPNVLLEGMASGLPIACSDRGAMPELLGSAGVYFDPESPQSIANALARLMRSGELRREKAALALEQARRYSWERCAKETFGFLRELVPPNVAN